MTGIVKFFIVVLFFLLSWSAPTIVTAQVFGSVTEMNFGSYEFSTSYNVQMQLGTDGNLSFSGSGATFNGGEAAGSFRITSPDTGTIEVRCAVAAELADPTATSLTIENIELAVDSGVSFGSGFSCHGAAGGDSVAMTIEMDTTLDPTVYIGGEIFISSAITLPSDHVYSTSGTGTPVVFSITIQ